jgi:hypothetical protein
MSARLLPRENSFPSHWHSVGTCYPAIAGAATSEGILGLGSARARVVATEDWEAQASERYGAQYGRLSTARKVQWDCKKGAVLLAKCVVTAEPCGARIRG